jgi:hypothetical protein
MEPVCKDMAGSGRNPDLIMDKPEYVFRNHGGDLERYSSRTRGHGVDAFRTMAGDASSPAHCASGRDLATGRARSTRIDSRDHAEAVGLDYGHGGP